MTDKTQDNVKKTYNSSSKPDAHKNTATPEEGQKNAKGQYYSGLYGEYVPGLYAQGR